MVSNESMTWRLFRSPWLISAVALAFLLPLKTRSQPSVPQPEIQLTATEEKDSYEIYSMLLKTEMPPQWKITAWAITEETQSFPAHGASHDYSVEACLQPSQDQESIYRPLIQDYNAKNKNKIVLKRKFDLPQYALVGPKDVEAIQRRQRAPRVPLTTDEVDHPVFPFDASVIFHVSAVGFNPDGTRALVYVGHECGSLCAGGRYHLLVRKNGHWQVDREYGGMSCGFFLTLGASLI